METKELTIEIPKGKIVDWDESKKQNKVVLKDEQLTYRDVYKKLFKDKKIFYIGTSGDIGSTSCTNMSCCDKNNALSKYQLECILAKNQLANVAKYLNDGWKPSCDSDIFLLIVTQAGVSVFEVANGSCASGCGSIWFKSRETAEQAIEILSEETIKLALEPLGI